MTTSASAAKRDLALPNEQRSSKNRGWTKDRASQARFPRRSLYGPRRVFSVGGVTLSRLDRWPESASGN